ncbi:MAG: ribosome-associated translation inhibitor RaiA [Salaquimonas sp.]|jgi:ribosomal subunit interface protein|nr:ribosome-associated translation inhibitor RaiA [Salaquimonas sp.]
MNLRISGKQMNIGEALNQRIEDRIEEAIGKYFDGGHTGHVIIEKSGSGFDCECTIHLDTGVVLQATAKGHEPTTCFEDAADKIEKRLRRYKRKLKDHRATASPKGGEASYTIVAPLSQEEEVPEDYNPVIIAESSTQIALQTVAQAVMQLDLTDKPVIVFTNAANGRTNVVYRRPDGNIGWIDPSSVS